MDFLNVKLGTNLQIAYFDQLREVLDELVDLRDRLNGVIG